MLFIYYTMLFSFSISCLGAVVKLLPCDHEVMGSSPGNSLLQKCRERLRTIDPKWSDPSLDPAQAGATCTRLPFLSVVSDMCFDVFCSHATYTKGLPKFRSRLRVSSPQLSDNSHSFSIMVFVNSQSMDTCFLPIQFVHVLDKGVWI
ncbi:hypothetical protein VPH35_075074 [Triticum aestivum]